MQISVKIDSKWVFSGRGEKGNTIECLKRAIREEWNTDIKDYVVGLTNCEMTYCGNKLAQEIANQIKQILEKITNEPYDNNVFIIHISENDNQYTLEKTGLLKKQVNIEDDIIAQINALQGIEPVASNNSDEESKETEAHSNETMPVVTTHIDDSVQEEAESQTNSMPNEISEVIPEERAEETEYRTLDLIHNLVGSKAFKELADEINLTANYIIENKTQSIFFSETYLFSINTGSGFHTSLSLLSKLISDVGLFEKVTTIEMVSIPSYNDPSVSTKMSNAISVIQLALTKQRLICIDLTEWIGHTNAKELKKLLMTIFRENDKCAIVFRIPYVKPAIIDEIVKDLDDIVSVKPVVFEPFNDEELREVANRYLTKHSFDLSEEAWKKFYKRIQDEKADGYFYGIHTVHKVIGGIIRKKELLEAKQGKIDKHIADEIQEIIAEDSEQEKIDHLEELRSMIGMEAITARVIEIINQIVYARKAGLKSQPTMHMCFIGNPGTGKTTVARIIGQILKERGILRIGKFFEHHSRDLCAEYVGQTAPKTHAICQEAYGSVLFIDEAYSLATDGDRYNYGKEAIDTLITEMENHSDDLVVIFAGYPDEISKMISLNPGMRSRVPYTLEFPNYTPKELAEIFMKMVNDNFTCTEDLSKHAEEFFMCIPADVMNDKTFGNGRFVRNIYERTWGKAIARGNENGFDSIVLNCQDFDEATKEYQYDDKDHTVRKIGF